jgi:5-methylcytosine-specific restriction enzyme A
MPTYLLTWNPERWQWTYIQDSIAQISQQGFCNERWSLGVTKRINTGDRVFLMKLGEVPRGIVASGWVASNTFQDVHWSNETKLALYADIHFDTILAPDREAIFPIELLQYGIYRNVSWTPQKSGNSIPDDVAEQLEKDWAKFLDRSVPVRQIAYADEINETKTFDESITKQVKVNIYERSAEARAICIKRYGPSCSVCGFDFGKKFGEIGEGFIHVHHLKPLSDIQGVYKLNPIDDLRPVCPNCHAMLHQGKPEPYSIEQLQAILKGAGS